MVQQNMKEENEYRSIDDIRLRKAQLRTEIAKDQNKLSGLWNSLVHKPKNDRPSQRFSGVLNTGAGIMDGLILGWKLYRKFR